MSKGKIILLLILSLLLIAVIACGIVFFIFNNSNDNEDVYLLSEKEEINVNIENKNIEFFEKFDFIGTDIDTIKEEFKNVVYINENNIKMGNVQWNAVVGDFVLIIKNNKIENFIFTSKTYLSANDVYTVFSTLNNQIASANKLETSKIYLSQNGTIKDFTSAEELFSENNYIVSSYTIVNKKLTLKTTFSDNVYTVVCSFA